MVRTIEQAFSQGVAAHKEGKLQDAENLYRIILQSQPLHPYANHNLGLLAVSVDKIDVALPFFKTALVASPKVEQFWLSYIDALIKEKQFDNAKEIIKQAKKQGVSREKLNLLELPQTSKNESENINRVSPSRDQLISLLEHYQQGRFGDAEKLAKSISREFPSHDFSWKILGSVLRTTGRASEAIHAHQKVVALSPQDAEAHTNLGNTLKALGRLAESVASHEKAIALQPEFAIAYNNLGNTLKNLGRLDEAKVSYTQAIKLKPNFVDAMTNLSNALSYMNNLEAEIASLKSILQIDDENYALRAGVNLAICYFLKGNFTESKRNLLAVAKIQEKNSEKFKNARVYWRYLSNILSWHEEKYFNLHNKKIDKILYVIGESHSLGCHQLYIKNSSSNLLCQAKLIKGCTQWHLGNSTKNEYKTQFENVFCSLPKCSEVLITIGEIDCRLDSGIINYKNKVPEKGIEEIIASTIENYLNFVARNNSGSQHSIIIQGVPCPNIVTENYPEDDILELIEVINIFNRELETMCKQKGFRFLDVYKLTNRGDGFSNALWHSDDIHLSPEGFLEAWVRYDSEQYTLEKD